jgi:hypothetical protein
VERETLASLSVMFPVAVGVGPLPLGRTERGVEAGKGEDPAGRDEDGSVLESTSQEEEASD